MKIEIKLFEVFGDVFNIFELLFAFQSVLFCQKYTKKTKCHFIVASNIVLF